MEERKGRGWDSKRDRMVGLADGADGRRGWRRSIGSERMMTGGGSRRMKPKGVVVGARGQGEGRGPGSIGSSMGLEEEKKKKRRWRRGKGRGV